MPITPRFKLSQTDSQLTITIHIPHIRVSISSMETLVDGSDFHFYSSPYLLHLSFPAGRLVDDAEKCREAKATYDPTLNNGTLTVVIWKEEEGHWPDMDLLSNLVNRAEMPTGTGMVQDKISVISSTDHDGKDLEGNDDDGDANSVDFGEDLKSCMKPHYGFLNMYHSVFTAYAREGLSYEMLEIPDPDETHADVRRDLRLDAETDKFDSERYLGDLFLSDDPNDEYADMIYVEAAQMVPHWKRTDSVDDLASRIHKLSTEEKQSQQVEFFTEDESIRLASTKAQLPPTSAISSEQKGSLLLSLMDILYAYAYDHRTTCGDPSCESSWTVVMISQTLSWFESYTPPYDNVAQVLRWSIRRAIIYPYLRNFKFVSKLLVNDLVEIFNGGRRTVLRCLLQIHKILDRSEFHYLFNKIYISPYICWVQQISDDDLTQFATEISICLRDDRVLEKASFALDLDILENNAFPDDDESRSSNDVDDTSSEEESSSDEEIEEKMDSDTESCPQGRNPVVKKASTLLDDQIGCRDGLNEEVCSNDQGLANAEPNVLAAMYTEHSGQEEKKVLIMEI
uniref:CS domain-containing protein n=1 Tax=Chaetoceros debilis TaxID=122233 RepID=A0A7S3PTR0_9STRA